MGYRIGDSVRAKLIDIKENGKLSFSMKETDPRAKNNGKLEPKMDEMGRRVGPITGILIDDLVKVGKRQEVRRIDRENSPDMWERKQLRGANVLHLVSENREEEDQEAATMVEEYTELELNADEAPFLRGQVERAA